jgi:hypothetical protein
MHATQQQQAGACKESATAVQQLQCQVASLLVTCINAAAQARLHADAGLKDAQVLTSIVLQAAVLQLEPSDGCSTAVAGSSSSSAAEMWVLLLARTLVESGHLLLRQATVLDSHAARSAALLQRPVLVEAMLSVEEQLP